MVQTEQPADQAEMCARPVQLEALAVAVEALSAKVDEQQGVIDGLVLLLAGKGTWAAVRRPRGDVDRGKE